MERYTIQKGMWNFSMKRKVFILGLVVLLFGVILGVTAFSDGSTNNIHKNAKLEDITFKKGKINIYIFWGSTCPHCEELFSFLNSINGEYGKYYDVYGFEVWEHDNNQSLMDDFSAKMNDDVGSSVPYIIIGNKSFSGYGSTMDEEIKETIEKEFEEKDGNSVFEPLIKEELEKKEASN